MSAIVHKDEKWWIFVAQLETKSEYALKCVQPCVWVFVANSEKKCNIYEKGGKIKETPFHTDTH